jgi:hypothetical protein
MFDEIHKKEIIKAKKKAEKKAEKAEKEKAEKAEKEKKKIFDSIQKSKHIVSQKPVETITGKILFPDMLAISKKSIDEVKNLRVSKIAGH